MHSYLAVLCALVVATSAHAIPLGNVCRGTPPSCTMPDGCSGQEVCEDGLWTGCDYAYRKQSTRPCIECGLAATQACGVGPTFYGPCTASCTTASGQPGQVTACTATGAPICQLPYRQRFPFPSATPGLGNSLGVNLHTLDPTQITDRELDLLANAGVRFVRLDTSVENYLANPQGYWPTWASWLGRLDARQMRAMMILGGSRTLPPFTATTYQQFADFARAAVIALQGRGVVWEVWNEPNLPSFWNGNPDVDNYALLAANTNLTIRLATPDEWLVGPALGHDGASYLDALLGHGYVLGYWDGITIHPYQVSEQSSCNLPPQWLAGPASWWWSSCTGVLQNHRAIVASHVGLGQATPPVLVGEWGYDLAQTSHQPELAARVWLIGYVAAVPLTVYYHWKDLPADTHRYGLADSSGNPTRAYWALAFLTSRLATATYLGPGYPEPSGPVQYHFRSAAGQDVYVAFEDSPGFRDLSVTPGSYRLDWLDLSSNPPVPRLATFSVGGTLTLYLDRMPRILTRTGP